MNSKKSIINKKCENTKNKHVSNRRGGNVSLYNGLTFLSHNGFNQTF